MKDGKLGFGLMGCGVAAGFHANAIMSFDDMTLVGVCDAHRESGETFAQKYGCTAFDSPEALLACEDIDAVCICTPSGLHAEQALAALRAGKHVLCEKPLAVTAHDAALVAKAAEGAGLTVDTVAQLRLTEGVRQLKEALAKGRLGKVTLVQLDMVYHRSDEYYASAPWRGTRAMDGGGALMNQGIHGMDLLLYLLGPVKRVQAAAATLVRPIETEDTAAAVLEFAHGALCTVAAATSVSPGAPRRLRVCGSEGCVTLTEDAITEWAVAGRKAPIPTGSGYASCDRPEAVPAEAHAGVLRDFADAVRAGRKPVSTAADGHNAVALIESIYRAAASGREQTPAYMEP